MNDLIWRSVSKFLHGVICEGVSKSFRTGRLERELQMVQLSLPIGAVVLLFCESG